MHDPAQGAAESSLVVQDAKELGESIAVVDDEWEPGLTVELDVAPQHERWLGEWARETHGSDFLFVTGYPMSKRPFYTHPNPADPAYSNSFDLLFRGTELVTGGQRLHLYQDYLDSANRDVPRLLGHVLMRGDMRLRELAVERLIATTDGRRQSLLVRHLDCLGHTLETRVLDGIGRVGPGLRHAMASRDPRMQTTVVRMVRDTQDQSLAYLVGEAACSPDCLLLRAR